MLMRPVWFLTLIAVLLAACASTGNAEQLQRGQILFTRGTDSAPACTLCHTLDGATLVGPSLQHIATTAQTRVSNQSAPDYIRASILTPSAYKVPGYETGTMAANYEASLTSEQVDDLVAFPLTKQ